MQDSCWYTTLYTFYVLLSQLIVNILFQKGLLYNYSGGWNSVRLKTNCAQNSNRSPLFGFPMAFGFPIVFEQNVTLLVQNHWKSQKGGHFVQNHWNVLKFGFTIVWFWNSQDHSNSLCYYRPFQNHAIGNPNLKMFGIPKYLVFHCGWYSNVIKCAGTTNPLYPVGI